MTIDGKVVDEKGQGVAHASLVAVPSADRRMRASRRRSRTEKYRIRGNQQDGEGDGTADGQQKQLNIAHKRHEAQHKSVLTLGESWRGRVLKQPVNR
jgi:hypothetical protein